MKIQEYDDQIHEKIHRLYNHLMASPKTIDMT